MVFVRFPLILAGSLIAILAYQAAGNPVGISAGQVWSPLTLTIVNLVWALMLGGLLLAGVFGVLFALYGVAGLSDLGAVFAGRANYSFSVPTWLAWAFSFGSSVRG